MSEMQIFSGNITFRTDWVLSELEAKALEYYYRHDHGDGDIPEVITENDVRVAMDYMVQEVIDLAIREYSESEEYEDS